MRALIYPASPAWAGMPEPLPADPGSATVDPVFAADPTGSPIRGRCTTPDGLGIATYDFGGRGPDLLLVHATGFCAAVFQPLARSLADDFHCWGLDLRAHGYSDRPAGGQFPWSDFATDVLAVTDHLGLVRPLAFGHSCGGAALFLAEERRPGAFRALHCYEPVVFPGPPVPPSLEGNPLSTGALRRRESFPSRTDAFLNFSSKPPFADLDPDALSGYLDDGFEPVPDSEGGDGQTIRLRCRREDEAQIYAAGGSHDAFLHLDRVACPVTLACGQQTDAFGLEFLEQDAQRLPSSRVEVLPGLGHFGPLQRPAEVAGSILPAFGPAPGTPRS
jgi:pimeloyl-ACP methyl ester carboxylesterase